MSHSPRTAGDKKIEFVPGLASSFKRPKRADGDSVIRDQIMMLWASFYGAIPSISSENALLGEKDKVNDQTIAVRNATGSLGMDIFTLNRSNRLVVSSRMLLHSCGG
ncbi:predicted protein [Histoplasma capsulatum var. duboisii H88]|uniref:Predicted protein n=2 Tax=Ajellomyces capsulatus TaxID=5037 RepID=F0U653_AJEC8|nr:predicted protein [Histoplasma capsulatum H143]EGC42236.1 predicted protein [Histoplasma capsulatum var. duboisii H88]